MDGHEGKYWFDEPLRGVSPNLRRDDMKEDIKPDIDLANIENALLTVAESIKYLADTYAEVNKPPEPLKVNHPDYSDGMLHEIPWRTARVGDWIMPTGQGLSPDNARRWSGVLVKVSRLDGKNVYWTDDVGVEHGGCYNEEDRLRVYEE